MGFWGWTGALDDNGLYTAAEVQYLVFDAEDENAALNAVFAEAPKEFNGLFLDSISYDERINETNHVVKVVYKGANGGIGLDINAGSFSFTTSGGTQKLKQSLQTKGRYPEEAPDMYGAIEYDGDEVAGVDVIRPSSDFSESRVVAKVTTAYRKKLAALTGKVNSKTFKGYAPGEVLFLGANASGKKGQPVEITYGFSASPNLVDFKIGGIEVAECDGWDYAWVTYEKKLSANSLVKKPTAVYVEKVYERADFRALGLGR